MNAQSIDRLRNTPKPHAPKCAATAAATVSARINSVFQAVRLPAPALRSAFFFSL